MLRNELETHLTEKIIPFWRSMRDDERGGYYGYLGYNLELRKDVDKGCILNSRILWFFSNAYLLLQEKTLLDEAKHAYEFLLSAYLDKINGGVYWSVSCDGIPSDRTKHTYNQAFAIYALSSYYKASGDTAAKALALELFALIEGRCRDELGYMEAFDEYFYPQANDKLSENGVMSEKTMNTLLHVFEAYTELYLVTGFEKVKESLVEILGMVCEHVYNPNKQRQEVFFDKDWNSLIDLHSYGHDIEASWLLDQGNEAVGISKWYDKIKVITRSLASRTFLEAYVNSSYLNEKDRGVVNTSRIWWVQAEAMVGLYNAYEKEPDRTEFLNAVNEIWKFIKAYLIDRREGSEWFSEVDEQGQPSVCKPIVEPWKCPYHNGRMCMELIRRMK